VEFDDLALFEELGQGSFATVHRATLKGTFQFLGEVLTPAPKYKTPSRQDGGS